MRSRGSSELYGFWNTAATAWRYLRRSSPDRPRSGRPSKTTSPDVGVSSISSWRVSVVLPLPDSPTTPSVRPRRTTHVDVVEGVDRAAAGRVVRLGDLARLEHPVAIDRLGRRPVRPGHAATATSALMQRTFTSPNASTGGMASLHGRLGERASGGEGAARREVGERRRLAGDRPQPAERLGMAGVGVEQRPGVRVARRRHDLADRARLDDEAAVHDGEVLAHEAGDGEVVGDEQQRQVALTAQLVEQAQDGHLRRHVERRRRLVGDQQPRFLGQGDGDGDALAHAAGELVRVALQPVAGVEHAEPLQQGDDVAIDVGPRAAGVRLGDLRAHGVQRVERGGRVLRDVADVVAQHLAHVAAVELHAGPDRRGGSRRW